MDISIIVGLITFYGILFTALLKSWSFILKRTDKEIDELISKFSEIVIRKDIDEIRKIKQINSTDIENIRKDFNLPAETKLSKKLVFGSEKFSYFFIILFGLILVSSFLLPNFTIANLTLSTLAILSFVFYLVAFIIDIGNLIYLRKQVDALENKIQEEKIILKD